MVEEFPVAVEEGVFRLRVDDAAACRGVPIPAVVRAIAKGQTAATVVELAVGAMGRIAEVEMEARIGVAEFEEHGPAQIAVLLAGYVACADKTVPTVDLEVVRHVVFAVCPFADCEELGPEELIPFDCVETVHDEVVRLKEEGLRRGVHGGHVVCLIGRAHVCDDVFDASVRIDLHFARAFKSDACGENAIAAYDFLRIGTEVVLFGGPNEIHVVARVQLRAARKRRAFGDLNTGVRKIGRSVLVEDFEHGPFGFPDDVLEDDSVETVDRVDGPLVAVDNECVARSGHVRHGPRNLVAHEIRLGEVRTPDQNHPVVGERGVLDGASVGRQSRAHDLPFDLARADGHGVPGRGIVGEGALIEFRERPVNATGDVAVAFDRDGVRVDASEAFRSIRKNIPTDDGHGPVNDAGRRVASDVGIPDDRIAARHDVLRGRRREHPVGGVPKHIPAQCGAFQKNVDVACFQRGACEHRVGLGELPPDDSRQVGVVDVEGGARHEGVSVAHAAGDAGHGTVYCGVCSRCRAVADCDGGVECLNLDVATVVGILIVGDAEDAVRGHTVELNGCAVHGHVFGDRADGVRLAFADDFVVFTSRQGEPAVGIVSVNLVGGEGGSRQRGEGEDEGEGKAVSSKSIRKTT